MKKKRKKRRRRMKRKKIKQILSNMNITHCSSSKN